MKSIEPQVAVIGGGLAGAEAAWQIARSGVKVALWEMRPATTTPAHVGGNFAELVCSNSLGSDLPDRAGGVLKAELRRLGSLIMECADKTRIPAGSALAVGREEFSGEVTRRIEAHPLITVVREEARAIPDGICVIATGPLTSPAFSESLGQLVGCDYLYFYDALSPIVTLESIDQTIAFQASRYQRGEISEGDYINCPMTRPQYDEFVAALVDAERISLRAFETEDPSFFEGCLPIEQLAIRGWNALAYGPLRPVGIFDPRTGQRPYAVVQLRQDNAAGSLYNMVGFQTNLKWPEQRRVFRMIPGLENAEFLRLGQMHRNTYINSPLLIRLTMQSRIRENLFFAGQITGIEGYVGNAGSGWLAGTNAARYAKAEQLVILPAETMLGSLANYVSTTAARHFQPMKANFGILPSLNAPARRRGERNKQYAERAISSLSAILPNT